MTIIECKGGYDGITVVWVGDGNNVSHSWINAAAVLGFNLNLACPEGYFPNADILKRANGIGPGRIRVTTDPVEAMQGADVIYTDVWASMGQESESIARKRVFKNYQVNNDLICHARKNAIVMHCLPAHRGEEISEALLECPASVVWDQSENKLHMNKAILEAFMCR